jgi:hypothetical protein
MIPRIIIIPPIIPSTDPTIMGVLFGIMDCLSMLPAASIFGIVNWRG